MTQGGTSNTAPVARHFFHPSNRVAICNLISDRDDRDNFAILPGQFNVCFAISESVDKSKIVDIKSLKQHCQDTTIHICVHFPCIKITQSVHQMLAHNWELFEMLEGGPIAVWSESGLEAWNKDLRNFQSGAGCRTRYTSAKSNLEGIFVRMLIISSQIVTKSRQDIFNRNRQSTVPHLPSLNYKIRF